MSVSNFSTLVNIFKYMSTFWEKKSVQKHFERAFVSNETRRDVVDHVLVSWSTAGPCQIPDYIAWLHREPTILVVISQSICHSKHYLVCFAFVSWCSDSSTTLKHNIPLPLAFVLFKWLHYGKVLRAQSNGLIHDGRGLQTFFPWGWHDKIRCFISREKFTLEWSLIWEDATIETQDNKVDQKHFLLCTYKIQLIIFNCGRLMNSQKTIIAGALIYS